MTMIRLELDHLVFGTSLALSLDSAVLVAAAAGSSDGNVVGAAVAAALQKAFRIAKVILGINPIAFLADAGVDPWIIGIDTQNSPRHQCDQYIGVVGGTITPGMIMELLLSNVG
jgi:hypothetical protein